MTHLCDLPVQRSPGETLVGRCSHSCVGGVAGPLASRLQPQIGLPELKKK